jgi:hypothetical protein
LRGQFVDCDHRAGKGFAVRRAVVDLRLERQQISRRPQQQHRIVLEIAKPEIAIVTKQLAQHAGLVTMVDAQSSCFLLADGTTPMLLCHHCSIIIR